MAVWAEAVRNTGEGSSDIEVNNRNREGRTIKTDAGRISFDYEFRCCCSPLILLRALAFWCAVVGHGG